MTNHQLLGPLIRALRRTVRAVAFMLQAGAIFVVGYLFTVAMLGLAP